MVAVERERFTIFVIAGKRLSMCCFKSGVGIGSRLQEVDFDHMITLRISSVVAGLK